MFPFVRSLSSFLSGCLPLPLLPSLFHPWAWKEGKKWKEGRKEVEGRMWKEEGGRK
jgi:hypothetical protein